MFSILFQFIGMGLLLKFEKVGSPGANYTKEQISTRIAQIKKDFPRISF
jgi:hypothetical protein